jgi:hypothetical protein
MKMKKFFGLKMTLAALAVMSFASCYDSEGGDVIIPNQTSVVWPDPVYVVNGVVTDWNGTFMAGVEVTGLALGQTTDTNGFYSAQLSSPFKGEVNFTKTGYFKTVRSLKMATLETGTAVYNLDATMYPLDGGLRMAIREEVADQEEGATKTTTAAQLAAIEADWGENIMTNNTDQAKKYTVDASYFPPQPYGVVAVASKTEEEGQALFYEWVTNTFGNDPWKDFRTYGERWSDEYTFTVPAMFKVTGIKVTPLHVFEDVIIPLEDGDYVQPVEKITDYVVEVEGVALDHDHIHAHGHADGSNGSGGGSGE